jgi:hypothetical protein
MSTAADPLCRTCRVSMEIGSVLDRAHAGRLHLPMWSPGKPTQKKLLGLPVGYARNDVGTIRVMTWRCPRCGLLESYAR